MNTLPSAQTLDRMMFNSMRDKLKKVASSLYISTAEIEMMSDSEIQTLHTDYLNRLCYGKNCADVRY